MCIRDSVKNPPVILTVMNALDKTDKLADAELKLTDKNGKTVLDVYKRQGVESGVLWYGLGALLLLSAAGYVGVRYYPVSYTHLDVYKRQA